MRARRRSFEIHAFFVSSPHSNCSLSGGGDGRFRIYCQLTENAKQKKKAKRNKKKHAIFHFKNLIAQISVLNALTHFVQGHGNGIEAKPGKKAANRKRSYRIFTSHPNHLLDLRAPNANMIHPTLFIYPFCRFRSSHRVRVQSICARVSLTHSFDGRLTAHRQIVWALISSLQVVLYYLSWTLFFTLLSFREKAECECAAKFHSIRKWNATNYINVDEQRMCVNVDRCKGHSKSRKPTRTHKANEWRNESE